LFHLSSEFYLPLESSNIFPLKHHKQTTTEKLQIEFYLKGKIIAKKVFVVETNLLEKHFSLCKKKVFHVVVFLPKRGCKAKSTRAKKLFSCFDKSLIFASTVRRRGTEMRINSISWEQKHVSS
jgi:hypothetical protein